MERHTGHDVIQGSPELAPIAFACMAAFATLLD